MKPNTSSNSNEPAARWCSSWKTKRNRQERIEKKLRCLQNSTDGKPSPMKLQKYRYKCNSCKQWYEHYDLAPYTYGEFLLRSEGNGTERYLNGLSDPVYKEVDRLLKSEPKNMNRSNLEKSEILQSVFGIACDPDEDESLFRIGRKPRCPYCESPELEYWEATDPPHFIELEIPHVTHHTWNTFNDTEKKQLLSRVLGKLGIK